MEDFGCFWVVWVLCALFSIGMSVAVIWLIIEAIQWLGRH